MGAEAQSATVMATLPGERASQIEENSFQALSGAVEVLGAAACAPVGGTTATRFALGGCCRRMRVANRFTCTVSCCSDFPRAIR